MNKESFAVLNFRDDAGIGELVSMNSFPKISNCCQPFQTFLKIVSKIAFSKRLWFPFCAHAERNFGFSRRG
jgi:hypothetical protein